MSNKRGIMEEFNVIKTLGNKMEKEIVYSQQIPYNYNTNINKIKNEKN